MIVGRETCDDGNKNDGKGCLNTCLGVTTGWECFGSPSVCSIVCGDGIIISPETCDDGYPIDGIGCNNNCIGEMSGWNCTGGSGPSICNPKCGDGIVVPHFEQCDDGNKNDN